MGESGRFMHFENASLGKVYRDLETANAAVGQQRIFGRNRPFFQVRKDKVCGVYRRRLARSDQRIAFIASVEQRGLL